MNKAFTRESDGDDADDELDTQLANPLPAGARNYISPDGLQRLKDELKFLHTKERPKVTAVVSWAARNGDRSENADYQYGKRRLREIDRRIRFLSRRIDSAEVVDPQRPLDPAQANRVFFGATVRYLESDPAQGGATENTVTIVGVDEIDLEQQHISWVAPLARALMKSRVGDVIPLRVPGGERELEILDIRYVAINTKAFQPVATDFGAGSEPEEPEEPET
ncbi:MAG: transcription elongation factor GreB [Gammaproteobacteria bacterium]